MERNIESEIDIFLSDLKIAIVLKDAEKLRSVLLKEMPLIKDVKKIKEAMGLHKLAYQMLKEENISISKEITIINQTNRFNKTIMSKNNSIYRARA